MRTTRYVTLIATALACALGCAGCRPPAASAVLETGGNPVDWRLKSTLSARGDLSLERLGQGIDLPANGFTAALLQVATGPDGQIYPSGLIADHYMALHGSDADLRFNLLAMTRGGSVCYVNSTLLNGTTDLVGCKPGDPATFGVGPTGSSAAVATPIPQQATSN